MLSLESQSQNQSRHKSDHVNPAFSFFPSLKVHPSDRLITGPVVIHTLRLFSGVAILEGIANKKQSIQPERLSMLSIMRVKWIDSLKRNR
jgi:hypothetical protein